MSNPKGPASDWTDERVEKLKELWGEGYSASQVATQLGGGISRCSVIGKVRRLNLPYRDGRKRISLPSQRPHIVREKKMPDPVEPIEAPPSLRIAVQDIDARQCRWIDGDPIIDSSMCGHPIERGSYCSSHFFRTRTQSPQKSM